MNSSRRQPMKSFKVTLSNGKSATVDAPSPQRARQAMERAIERKGSALTVVSVF
jgi:hypothetical protein